MNKVKIVEVGPRDGLQNEKLVLATEVKSRFIKLLLEANFESIEITSFVKPTSIPQMSDAHEVVKSLRKENEDLDKKFIALVPNLMGLENALNSGLKEIAVFTSTSDSFNKKNINSTVADSLFKIKEICTVAKSKKLRIRGYISTVFGCPYEGNIPIDRVMPIVSEFEQMGVDEISMGDTIGVATPLQVRSLIKKLKSEVSLSKIAMHFHDTRGLALVNVYESLENEIRIFDSSAGGLGGCPYAKGATGNLATEDLIYLLNSMGMVHGVDLTKLLIASDFILSELGKESPSKYRRAFKLAVVINF